LKDNKFCTPKANGYDSIESAFNDIKNNIYSFPVIVKPVDSSGSKGVGRIDIIDDAKEALEYAMSFSKNGRIIVEEFVEKNDQIQIVHIHVQENVMQDLVDLVQLEEKQLNVFVEEIKFI
jgi:biotin carboxylase